MNEKHISNSQYISSMMLEFVMPPADALTEYWLCLPTKQPKWDMAVYLSTDQSNSFYSDVFQFWVRALFCFNEDLWLGSMFKDIVPDIDCRSMSAQQFEDDLVALLGERVLAPKHLEESSLLEVVSKFRERTYTDAYSVVSRPGIKSAVASSDGEYIVYFVLGLA